MEKLHLSKVDLKLVKETLQRQSIYPCILMLQTLDFSNYEICWIQKLKFGISKVYAIKLRGWTDYRKKDGDLCTTLHPKTENCLFKTQTFISETCR